MSVAKLATTTNSTSATLCPNWTSFYVTLFYLQLGTFQQTVDMLIPVWRHSQSRLVSSGLVWPDLDPIPCPTPQSLSFTCRLCLRRSFPSNLCFQGELLPKVALASLPLYIPHIGLLMQSTVYSSFGRVFLLSRYHRFFKLLRPFPPIWYLGLIRFCVSEHRRTAFFSFQCSYSTVVTS